MNVFANTLCIETTLDNMVKLLPSGDSALIDLKFLCHSEYLHCGRAVITWCVMHFEFFNFEIVSLSMMSSLVTVCFCGTERVRPSALVK